MAKETPAAVANSVAVNLQQAAALTGMSVVVLRRAIRANKLVAHYPTTKPVILIPDLTAWISQSPTESYHASVHHRR
jgi:hypothetical protein